MDVTDLRGPTGGEWTTVCRLDQIIPGTGVCALVRGRQVAVVRSGDGHVYALGNFDPFSNAFVIARGIVGTCNGVPKIASPIYKQTFDLRNGRCLEQAGVSIPSYPARIVDGAVEVQVAEPAA